MQHIRLKLNAKFHLQQAIQKGLAEFAKEVEKILLIINIALKSFSVHLLSKTFSFISLSKTYF